MKASQTRLAQVEMITGVFAKTLRLHESLKCKKRVTRRLIHTNLILPLSCRRRSTVVRNTPRTIPDGYGCGFVFIRKAISHRLDRELGSNPIHLGDVQKSAGGHKEVANCCQHQRYLKESAWRSVRDRAADCSQKTQ